MNQPQTGSGSDPTNPHSDRPGRGRVRLTPHGCRSRMAGLALVFLCLTVYVPGLRSIPPVDRDEARFAQASRQMFESVAGTPGYMYSQQLLRAIGKD